jgi:hypothetical protein
VTAAALAATVDFIQLILATPTKGRAAAQADILVLAELVQMEQLVAAAAAAAPALAAAAAALAATAVVAVAQITIQLLFVQAREMEAAALVYMGWAAPALPAARVVVAGEIHMVLVNSDTAAILAAAVAAILAARATAPVQAVD